MGWKLLEFFLKLVTCDAERKNVKSENREESIKFLIVGLKMRNLFFGVQTVGLWVLRLPKHWLQLKILPIKFHHSLKSINAKQDLKTQMHENEATKIWQFLSPRPVTPFWKLKMWDFFLCEICQKRKSNLLPHTLDHFYN